MTTPPLATATTMHVGGPAAAWVDATSEAEFIGAISQADAAGTPVLVLGGGSNVVVADAGFPGVVVRDRRSGVEELSRDTCGGASVRVVAGHLWDDLVRTAVEREWVGVEALSGVPGTVGAAPVQNIGAYGQEIAGAVASVRTWDRATGKIATFAAARLGFGYRTSILRQSMTSQDGTFAPSPRYIVLDVEFQFRLGSLSTPIAYAQLARHLGIEVGQRAPMSEVRAAVVELRASKGMLADDPAHPDHDRWSAGSFFTNPVIPAAHADQLPADAPRYPVRTATPEFTFGPSLGAIDPTLVKTSAAWLIEHAGFPRGFGVHGAHSAATLSTRHTLAITNRGHATAADILELANVVRARVRDTFGITLEPEPILVGLTLD